MNEEPYNLPAANLKQKIAILSEDHVRDAVAALACLTALESFMDTDYNKLCVGLTNRF